MKIQKISDRIKNADLVLANAVWRFYLQNRYKIYILILFLGSIQILNYVPYVNLYILPNNLLIYSFAMLVMFGRFDGFRMIKLCVAAFILQAVLLVLGKESAAEGIASGTYMALAWSAVTLIRNHKKYVTQVK